MLGDFGAAGLIDAHTVTGSVALSIAYAAPEMLEHGEMSPATDLYALGATLYHVVTGRLPFGAPDGGDGAGDGACADSIGIGALLRMVATEPPPPIEVPDVAPRLDATITSLLSKDPEQRSLDASEVAGELRAAPTATSGRSAARGRWLVAAGLVAVTVAAIAVGGRDPSIDGAVGSTLDGSAAALGGGFERDGVEAAAIDDAAETSSTDGDADAEPPVPNDAAIDEVEVRSGERSPNESLADESSDAPNAVADDAVSADALGNSAEVGGRYTPPPVTAPPVVEPR